MSHSSHVLGCLLTLALVGIAVSQDKPAPDKPESKAAKDKMIAAGELYGKVIDFNRDDQRLTLQVTVTSVVPNPDAVAKQAELQQELAAAVQIPDPAERFPRLRELQLAFLQNQANLVMVQQENHDVPLQIAEGVKIRKPQPEMAFDDKGKPRRYTAEELKKLKGPDNLPGYQGELDDVKVNQVIRVALVRKVLAKPDPLADPPKPEIRVILIVAELPQ